MMYAYITMGWMICMAVLLMCWNRGLWIPPASGMLLLLFTWPVPLVMALIAEFSE